jgi:hypothetical protein
MICDWGHDHSIKEVHVSTQQQGMYSRKALDAFHCASHDMKKRDENWRPKPLKMALDDGHVPCRTCFPKEWERFRIQSGRP